MILQVGCKEDGRRTSQEVRPRLAEAPPRAVQRFHEGGVCALRCRSAAVHPRTRRQGHELIPGFLRLASSWPASAFFYFSCASCLERSTILVWSLWRLRLQRDLCSRRPSPWRSGRLDCRRARVRARPVPALRRVPWLWGRPPWATRSPWVTCDRAWGCRVRAQAKANPGPPHCPGRGAACTWVAWGAWTWESALGPRWATSQSTEGKFSP
mmetsp:Transcript_25970/g.59852  ORF Transcript_25970/g.59852 Transcript_25970/m.59852 type:complete len:211 (+) Transcript_25970:2281-2913(+)